MGGSIAGNFGNTKGALEAISDALAVASLVPGLDTFADLAAVPVDLARGDFVSAGLDAFGAVPFIGEIADTARLARTANKAADAVRLADKSGIAKRFASVGKSSPLKIPKRATAVLENKKGYTQIKYTWETGKFKYTSRWHTRTPNAPKNQGNTWVVERKVSGVGHGKNARPKREEVLVGKNKWISKKEWRDAITARKKGVATKKQKEWLDNGHWKAD